MPKAILVMDMPESCDFADDTQPPRYGERTLYCNAPGIGDDVTDYIACRPDWCPLRELPEKKETVHSQECYTNSYFTDEMNAGWNACIDEILKANGMRKE
jgi:hypothetical protein